MTGGQLQNFKEGWAAPIGNFGPAHYYIRHGAGDAVASCRSDLVVIVRYLYAIGSWHTCKRCLRKHGEPTHFDRTRRDTGPGIRLPSPNSLRSD